MGIPALALLLAGQSPAPPPDPAGVSAERLGATLRELCAQPRFAGSASARRAADYAAAVFAEAGLRVERADYLCFLPRQTAESLELRGEDGAWSALDLREPPNPADPLSASAAVPPMLGLCAPGAAEGALFYAGYGTAAEFAELRARHGAACDGAIALMRYGLLYRGLKLANAEAAGFGGALLYTDELDDGAARGPVLPEGRWRPPGGIQRGSVNNADGDPLTPGWAALPEASRQTRSEASGLVRIPGLPISQANAARLMGGAERALGPLPARVRMRVEQDEALVPVQDVIGWIEGGDLADEWVILGAHRDSWGPGAVDNGTGSAVLLETARVVGAAVSAGWRPRRTLVFATWDAEEWGLVGSTEWVEQHARLLRERAVAYVNLDVVASGPDFGATCTPGLVGTLLGACAAEGLEAPALLGAPGGGSDHVPFLELGAVEVLTFGFGGGSGTYHSALDTPWVVENFLDPGFLHHTRAARFGVTLARSLAEAEAPVDGVRGWLRHAVRAAEEARADGEAQQRARLELQVAALKAALAAEQRTEDPPFPAWRFARHFLPASAPGEPWQRSLLWRSAGYGSAWFPEGATEDWKRVRAMLAEVESALR
jgi:N-acetylated-alpha-linked acidic dipeptidase